MEEKGLKRNAGKTNLMICGTGLDLQQSSCEFPCANFYSSISTAMAANTGYIRNKDGCSLDNMLSAGRGRKMVITSHLKTGWKQFR